MADHEWVGIHFVIIRWNVPYFLDGGDCKWISCNSVDSMSVFLLKKLFPEDERTLLVLKEYYQKVKNKFHTWKEKHKRF